MPTLNSISAGKTDYARELHARGDAERILLGDWSFQVGTDGFNPVSPDESTPVDFSQQLLSAPLGAKKPLGRDISTGAAATATVLADGQVQIDGLVGMVPGIKNRWLQITGGGVLTNGTWLLTSYLSATSITVYNPLMTADDLGPLTWTLRESCVLFPNDKAVDFFGRLPDPDPTTDGNDLGQVGIFCRILAAPTDPSLIGLDVLFAVAHHGSINKFAEMALNYHICVQA